MTTQQYAATVTIGAETFVGTVPMSQTDYAEFLLGEFSAKQFVFDTLQLGTACCAGQLHDSAHVTLQLMA